MSVIFEEENDFHIRSRKLLGDYDTPGSIKFLLSTGIVKNEKQALYVLVLVIIVCLGAAWWLVGGFTPENTDVVLPDGTRYTAEEFIRLENLGRSPLE